jgi:hypothetical protein
MAKKDLPDPKSVIEAANTEARVEFIKGFDPDKLSDEQKLHLFEQALLERAKDLCSNCGSDHKVQARMIVPLEAGGKFSFDNGTTLCRACEMASSVVKRSPTGAAQRPVNFWVSRRMYDKVKLLNGFNSTGSLVRFLMSKFVAHDDQFDDLNLWQETGSDMKINVWVDKEIYTAFKTLVNERGMTVTDSFKALIRMYEEEAEPLVQMKKKELDG